MATNKTARRKTEHGIYEILSVKKRAKNQLYSTTEQQRVNALADGEVPEGCFVLLNGRIHCPKKRGEVVTVRYTSVFQEEV